MRQQNVPPSNPVHRFIATFCFLLSGVILFVTITGLFNGKNNFIDVMLQLCLATMLALLCAIYSVPEADPTEEDKMPVTKRSHLEIEKMRGRRF